MKNARIWSAVGSKYDVVLVDDQSPFDDLADIAALIPEIRVIQTYQDKETDNSLNQLNAIKLGLDTMLSAEHSHIWVIDADDHPNLQELDFLNDIERNASYAFSGILEVENSLQREKIIPIRRRYWISRLTTSQILLSKEDFETNFGAIFNTNFSDIWYDARLNFLLNKKFILSDKAICTRLIHGENDSLRYRGNILNKFLRYFRAYFSRAKILGSGC